MRNNYGYKYRSKNNHNHNHNSNKRNKFETKENAKFSKGNNNKNKQGKQHSNGGGFQRPGPFGYKPRPMGMLEQKAANPFGFASHNSDESAKPTVKKVEVATSNKNNFKIKNAMKPDSKDIPANLTLPKLKDGE